MGPQWTNRCLFRWLRVVAVLMLLSFALPVVGAAGAAQAAEEKIAPAVRAQLAAQKESVVWVVLRERANLAPAYTMKNWEARGRFVLAQLQAAANRSQAGVRNLLRARGRGHRAYWIVNALKVTADARLVAELAGRPEVERIVLDGAFAIPEPLPGKAQPRVQGVEWNIERVRAPEVWDNFGARGEGIVVANIDTGVQFDHPALVGQYRGNLGAGGFDHNYSWFDPTGICGGVPCDNVGHGTHTMGTMVGDDGAGNQIGVAPDARWIAVKGCETDSCSYEALLAAGQWILAPTDLSGANPRPELRPNIVNNSWGGGHDDFYLEIVERWTSAGIFPQFSIGNAGPGCGSAGSPGDYFVSYAAGAFDSSNNIADFSGRGPSFNGDIKPNISAPGVDVRSSLPGNGYGWYSGTSMASPHVAGTVALIWSAAPDLVGQVYATRDLLDQTAVDVIDASCDGAYPPPPGPSADNNVWGEGRLDAFLAVDLAPRGPIGTLAGTVADTAGTPLAGATLQVAGPSNRTVSTAVDGTYSVRLPVGDYSVGAALFGYVGATAAATVQEGLTTTLDFALAAAPAFPLSGSVTSAGAPVANATVTLLNTPLPPATTGPDGRYSFPSVPVGAYDVQAAASGCFDGQTLPLVVGGPASLDFALTRRSDAFGYFCGLEVPAYVGGDALLPLSGDDGAAEVPLPFPFTFYGQTYSTAYVSTNGVVGFLEPNASFGNGAIPSADRPDGAIYAFWDDLYVAEDSGIYTRLIDDGAGRRFVIEWRNVHFCCVSEEALDIEVVLHEGGAILVQYFNVGASGRERGDSATLGIENESGTVALQFSSDQPVIAGAELAVRYDLPPSGFVQGSVSDANDGLPVAGATVQALRDGAVIREVRADAAGAYRVQLPVGAYRIAAASAGYETATAAVSVAEGATLTQSFTLRTARAEISPGALELVVPVGQTVAKTLTLRNTGSAPMTWELRESGGGRITAPTSAGLLRNPSFSPLARTTRGMYSGQVARGWSPSAPGNVIRSWSTSSLEWAWGLGYTGELWLSDNPSRSNHEFTAQGAATGRSWPALWSGDWPADMAYDEGRGLVCQVKVGADNGIACWSPATGEVVAAIGGAFGWTSTSQRGLAYRPDDDSFYIGGWNGGVIYHIAGLGHATPGAVLGQCSPPDGSISGLAWNAAAEVLWEATNSPDDTIYQLNPDSCAVLSTLPHPNPGYNGAGLELDEEGNLWMLSQSGHTAYLVESGVPAFGDVPWLAASPAAGTLAPGASAAVQVTFDTRAVQAGIYHATLFLRSSSGRQPSVRVPVSLVAPAYYRAVNAGGPAYTDGAGERWVADQRYSAGGWGYTSASARVDSTRKAIAGTDDDALFQNARIDPIEYRFDGLAVGIYQVELRFAEILAKRVGMRPFDVYIENGVALPAHDIVYEVGPLAADSHTFLVPVTDGQLNLRFADRGRGYLNPLVSAIRVIHRPDR